MPTIVSYLLEGEKPAADLSRLRFCRSASAALPPEHLRGFERKFGLGVIETMGLTETAAPSFSNPLDPAQRKLGAVGRALGCEPRIIDAELRPLPDGQTGELAIRGPNVMRGYFKNEEATAAACWRRRRKFLKNQTGDCECAYFAMPVLGATFGFMWLDFR